MNNKTILIIILSLLLILSFIIYTKNNKLNQNEVNDVISSDFLSLNSEILSLNYQNLTNIEKEGLLYMREEEKLARDVYITLYDKWNIPIFSNISQSEQTHTDAVRTILNKYNIVDPVKDDTVGVFVNANLQKMYSDLVNRGLVSLEEALVVGALIEDLDISDLEKYISETDNEDIKFVYENLTRGSRNHMRSFVSQLNSRNVNYVPQYISEEKYKMIMNSPKETGSTQGRGWGGNR